MSENSHFYKGQPVINTKLARETIHHGKKILGIVTSNPRKQQYVNVKPENRKNSYSYHVSFWDNDPSFNLNIKDLKSQLAAAKAEIVILEQLATQIDSFESETKSLREARQILGKELEKEQNETKRLREALREIINECDCTELCTCSSVNKKIAQAALDGGKA